MQGILIVRSHVDRLVSSYVVKLILFAVFFPSILSLIQLISPYEDVGAGEQQLPIKVIKLDENNRPYLAWCCRGSSGRIVDYDRYVLVLRNGHGVVESGDSPSTYSLEMAGAHDITVVLHNGIYDFVYEVRDTQLYPVKRKMPLDDWKLIVSLVGSVLMVFLITWLVKKFVARRIDRADSIET